MIVTVPKATDGAESKKSVADPTTSYLTMLPLWGKSRAVCNGERAVKEYDDILDLVGFTNLLIPFSPSMSPEQYQWYKSEAELPGIVSQYAKVIVGGLLRKKPSLELPEDAPEDAMDWIMNQFAQDGSPLVNFLDQALWEEMQTSRAWVYIDYPAVEDAKANAMTKEDFLELKPYPVIWNAESIVNYRVGVSSETGNQELKMVIVRNYEEDYKEGEYHPTLVDTVWVHELKDNKYQITKYQNKSGKAGIPVINGAIQQNYTESASGFEQDGEIIYPKIQGEPMTVIPAWPLNGSIGMVDPILNALIDRELSLYNKLSRRNHLLYGASTYTPWIASDMPDEDFEKVVGRGLGSWIHIPSGDTIGVLETPTAALQDMDRAISATLEEMAKMGIRMLSPEVDQSGIALEIRNAAQTAQLGTLNTKVSNQMSSIIAFMLNWRYGTDYKPADVKFKLSDDFNPAPLGADWLRLITEWYQAGLIPRTVWLSIMKQNDIVPPEYDDKEGQKEINGDPLVVTPREDMQFAAQLQKEVTAQKTGQPTAKPAVPPAKK
jgi:hypothetical protein